MVSARGPAVGCPARVGATTPRLLHATPAPVGWRRELRDAISPRTVVLVLGVLLLQLGFIASYVGAFRRARPRSVPITVVAPDGAPAGTAGGASVSTAVTEVVRDVEAAQQRSVGVVDAVPLQSGDGRGLTGSYAVTGWIVGGYLLASLLGVARGSRPAGHLAALWGLGALLVLAAATVTMAFQVMLGVLGIGLTVAVFVVLGGPSAGGAHRWPGR